MPAAAELFAGFARVRGQAQGLTLPFFEWAGLQYGWRTRLCSVLSC